MSELMALSRRIRKAENALSRIHRPERGKTLYKMGTQALTVRYTHTASTVPYTANVWSPSTVFVPAGGQIWATMLVDNRFDTAGTAMNYLRLWNDNPPSGYPANDNVSAKHPMIGQSHRRFPTLELENEYTVDTTVQYRLEITEIHSGVIYYVFETWTRFIWAIWL